MINGKLIYKGKTKDVYELDNGNCLLFFKDDMTGENGKFDPGANTIGLSIGGIGREWLRMTKYFFEKIEAAGFPTHFVSADLENGTMEVLKAKTFGKGLEAICRFKSTGSFMRRYGDYAKEGQDLDAIVEFTLKDDGRGDPVISADTLNALNIMTLETHDQLKKLTADICRFIRDELAKLGITLYDIKLEYGMYNGNVILIDEIAGGNMRVYKDEQKLEPLEIAKIIAK